MADGREGWRMEGRDGGGMGMGWDRMGWKGREVEKGMNREPSSFVASCSAEMHETGLISSSAVNELCFV